MRNRWGWLPAEIAVPGFFGIKVRRDAPYGSGLGGKLRRDALYF